MKYFIEIFHFKHSSQLLLYCFMYKYYGVSSGAREGDRDLAPQNEHISNDLPLLLIEIYLMYLKIMLMYLYHTTHNYGVPFRSKLYVLREYIETIHRTYQITRYEVESCKFKFKLKKIKRKSES